MINVFTDGGARGNPGPAGIGVFVVNEKNDVLFKLGKKIGETTNNIAEYKAVIAALSWLLEQKDLLEKENKINFFLDSLLLVSQINGLFKVKSPHLQNLFFEVKEIQSKLDAVVTYSHIPREKNKEADKLVNFALDNL